MFERIKNIPSESSDLSGNCVVCYDTFNTTDKKPIAFQCGHILCIECICKHVETCPKCNNGNRITTFIPLYV